jgi:hypothetical protein
MLCLFILNIAMDGSPRPFDPDVVTRAGSSGSRSSLSSDTASPAPADMETQAGSRSSSLSSDKPLSAPTESLDPPSDDLALVSDPKGNSDFPMVTSDDDIPDARPCATLIGQFQTLVKEFELDAFNQMEGGKAYFARQMLILNASRADYKKVFEAASAVDKKELKNLQKQLLEHIRRIYATDLAKEEHGPFEAFFDITD